MSIQFQPGQHPSADQLAAFAEHALPPHEQQQTLTHLARCAECRRIVYLAQEAIPAPAPAPMRRQWFSGWALAWPVAAALACLVVVTLLMREHTARPAEQAAM